MAHGARLAQACTLSEAQKASAEPLGVSSASSKASTQPEATSRSLHIQCSNPGPLQASKPRLDQNCKLLEDSGPHGPIQLAVWRVGWIRQWLLSASGFDSHRCGEGKQDKVDLPSVKSRIPLIVATCKSFDNRDSEGLDTPIRATVLLLAQKQLRATGETLKNLTNFGPDTCKD